MIKINRVESFLQALTSLVTFHAFIALAVPVFESCFSLEMLWFIILIAPWFISQFYMHHFRLFSYNKKLDAVAEGFVVSIVVIVIPLLLSLVIANGYIRETENITIGSFFYILTAVVYTLLFYLLYLIIRNIGRILRKITFVVHSFSEKALTRIGIPREIASEVAQVIATIVEIFVVILILFMMPFLVVLYMFYGFYIAYKMVGFLS